mmetsp:Transcript_42487/g.101085  ORF Transcript_42487/g.101085 Transcript_42487/m.101085 type:complete len:218 (-) Transcript_42487:520-1173(-)
MAVVDEESRALCAHHPQPYFGRVRARVGAHLCAGVDLRVFRDVGHQLRHQAHLGGSRRARREDVAEVEGVVRQRDVHHLLAPPLVSEAKLADGQTVEKLLPHDDGWHPLCLRNFGEAVVPVDGHPRAVMLHGVRLGEAVLAERLALHLLQRGRCLHHVHGEGVDERAGVRHGGERAEDVGHHRSPPGTQLDELHLSRRPGGLPRPHDPDAHHLAKDL